MEPEFEKNAKWTLYDLQDKLRQSGWMVPAYTLPAKLEKKIVMRVVVRQGFSRDMADQLLTDIAAAVNDLQKLQYPTTSKIATDNSVKVHGSVYTHTGSGKQKK